MSLLICASGSASTNGMPSLLARTTSAPPELTWCSGTRPRARLRTSGSKPPVESARLTMYRTLVGGYPIIRNASATTIVLWIAVES